MRKYQLEKDIDGLWKIVSDKGEVVLSGEFFTIASDIELALNYPPQYATTEAEEVAEKIRKRMNTQYSAHDSESSSKNPPEIRLPDGSRRRAIPIKRAKELGLPIDRPVFKGWATDPLPEGYTSVEPDPRGYTYIFRIGDILPPINGMVQENPEKSDNNLTTVQEYHCPNCNAKYSMYPIWIGKKRAYKCEQCGKMYGSKELDKAWGRIGKQISPLSVIPESLSLEGAEIRNPKSKEIWKMTRKEFADYLWDDVRLSNLTNEQWNLHFNKSKPKGNTIKVYRGYWQKERGHLVPGDWVTLDYKFAKENYAGPEGKVLSKEVPLNELIVNLPTSQPGKSELIWQPEKSMEFQTRRGYETFEEHHRNIIRQAIEEGKTIPKKVLKEYPSIAKMKKNPSIFKSELWNKLSNEYDIKYDRFSELYDKINGMVQENPEEEEPKDLKIKNTSDLVQWILDNKM